MVFLELAIQSVRGCSASARVALKPGYTVVKAPQAAVPPLSSLVLAICYPDARGGDAAFLAPGAKAGRAGVSLQADNGSTFRLVRELGAGGALHKLNPTSRAFEVVTQNATEIGPALRAQAGMPQRSVYEQLYTLNSAQLPSKRPRKGGGKAKGESASGPRAQDFDDLSGEDLKEYEARVPLLEKELADAKVLADLQFKQDGIQAELYAAETKLGQWEEARKVVAEARKEYESAPTAEKLGLPKDVIDQLKRCEVEVKKRSDALRKINDERDGSHVLDQGRRSVQPLWKDQQFTVSMAAGTALTVLGAYLEGPPQYVAMGAVVPWSFAAIRALAFVEEAQAASKQTGRYEVHAGREKKLFDERALYQAQIDTAFEKLQVDTMEEFINAMNKRETVQQTLAEAELKLAELDADPAYTALPQKVAELRTELEKIQEHFHGVTGGYFRGVNEIEKELARIKESVRRAKGGALAAAPAAEAAGTLLEDPGPAVLAAAADLLQVDVAKAAVDFKDRCGQYVAALSDKRWQGVEIAPDGRGTLVAAGKKVAIAEAPPRDADLYFFALKLSVVEKLGAKFRLPLAIEDCFAEAIDPARFPLLNRMLKHLGSVTQVLHVCGSGQNAFQADALVSV